jgi:hypothetical protein
MWTRASLHTTRVAARTQPPNRPWGLVAAIILADEPTAIRFERYLKSGSGRAFAKRHFEA